MAHGCASWGLPAPMSASRWSPPPFRPSSLTSAKPASSAAMSPSRTRKPPLRAWPAATVRPRRSARSTRSGSRGANSSAATRTPMALPPIWTSACPAGGTPRRRWCSARAARRAPWFMRWPRPASGAFASSTARPSEPRRWRAVSRGPAWRSKARGAEREAAWLAGADLVVNTRPWGAGEAEPDLSALAQAALVTDIVYVPLETPILRAARQRGHRTADGLGMLLHQAVPGFERWFGRRPSVSEELRQALLADIEAAR